VKLQQLQALIYRSSRRGQIVVLTVCFIVFFLGVAGLAIDVGALWNTRRQMQTAADAAAIAAANDLAVQDTTDLITDAQNAAAGNGFADGGTTTFSNNAVAVNVQNPPGSGAYAGNSNAVAVQITQNQPTQFLRFAGFTTIPVQVTATGLTTPGGSCVYSLDPSSSGAFTIAGSSAVTSACGLYVDSSSSSAAVADGDGTIAAPRLGVVGGTTISGGGITPVSTGIPAFGDPLSYIAAPTVPTCPNYFRTNLSSLAGPMTESPPPTGYCGGLTISAGANVTFNPGLYIINGGGLTIASTAANPTTVIGNGVTFYLTGSSSGRWRYRGVSIDSTATVQLSAPNSCGAGTAATGGSINGMLFFQDRAITAIDYNSSTISGGATSFFDGALYFSTTALNYAGSSSSPGYTYLVANDLAITGNVTIGNNYSCLNGQSLINNASLVM
jgi:Flp pilus assembly protein TadG